MGKVNFNSAVFNDEQRAAVISRALTRLAKRFKSSTVDKMETGTHTGVIYQRSSGPGFRRFHQASARGESPAPDTFNLVNNVKDEKISQNTHRVYVDDAGAPYGKWLQNPEGLDRPIATKADAEAFIATPEARQEIQQAATELTKVGGTL